MKAVVSTITVCNSQFAIRCRHTKNTIHALVISAVRLVATLTLVAAILPTATMAADEVHAYNILPGPLGKVLSQFAAEAGVTLTFTPSQTEGLESPGLQGKYTLSDAFKTLLQGSTLTSQRQGDNRYILQSINDTSAMSLPTMKISASPLDSAADGLGYYNSASTNSAAGLSLSLRETPQSVSVMTRQRLDDQALTSVNEVIRQVPGLHIDQTGHSGAQVSAIYVRGFKLENYLIDGQSIHNTALQDTGGAVSGVGMMDPAIYDRITVVRGATGLMTGEGDPSGSIDFVRKRPTREFFSQAGFALGRWQRKRLEYDVSGTLLGDGLLRGRLVAVRDAADDSWIERHDGGRKTTVYGVLDAHLSKRTVASLSLEYAEFKDQQAPAWGFPIADALGRPTTFGREQNSAHRQDDLDVSRDLAAASLEHVFNNGWRAKVSMNKTWLNHKQDLSVFYGDLGEDGRSGLLWVWRNQNTASQQGSSARLSGDYTMWGRQHQFFAALEHQSLDQDDPYHLFEWIPIEDAYAYDGDIPRPDLQIVGRITQRLRRSSATLSSRLSVTPALSLIGGLRVGRFHQESSTAGFDSEIEEDGITTPYFGAVYDFADSWTAYSSYTSIFNPQSNKDREGRFLAPEEGINIELGLRKALLNDKLTLNTALYHSKKDNLALIDTGNLTPSGEQAYRAADYTKAHGYELELIGEVTPRWDVSAGYTWNRIEDRDKQRLLRNVPNSKFTLFTTYRTSDAVTLGGGLNWYASMKNTTHPIDQGSYAVANLMMRYAFNKQLNLSLDISNLFDKSYLTTVDFRNYGEPRRWQLAVRYQF